MAWFYAGQGLLGNEELIEVAYNLKLVESLLAIATYIQGVVENKLNVKPVVIEFSHIPSECQVLRTAL